MADEKQILPCSDYVKDHSDRLIKIEMNQNHIDEKVDEIKIDLKELIRVLSQNIESEKLSTNSYLKAIDEKIVSSLLDRKSFENRIKVLEEYVEGIKSITSKVVITLLLSALTGIVIIIVQHVLQK